MVSVHFKVFSKAEVLGVEGKGQFVVVFNAFRSVSKSDLFREIL